MAPDRAKQAGAAPGDSISRLEQRALRRFTLAEGAAMVTLGTLALIFPLVASVWLTGGVALVFLVAGIVSWITTLARARHLSGPHAFGRFLVATLLVLTGIWMVSQLSAGPVAATSQVAALALAAGVVFVLEGIVASLFSLSHRQIHGWGWGLANGMATLAIGGLILTIHASHLPRVLGLLVAISFLFSGLDLLGFRVRFHPLASEDAP
jgi:uncharacterized membrane protein HdeD (DUF308 family)